MAKLGARGRKEIFRVSKETHLPAPDQYGFVWRKHSIALMSDGNFLERSAWKSKDGGRNPGHWKVRGKIKADLSAEKALEIYAKKGYVVEEALGLPNFDRAYYAALAAAASGSAPPPPPKDFGDGKVIRTAKKAEREKTARVKAAAKREHEQRTKHGPGFYVRNRTTSEYKPWATNHSPFATVEEALDPAWRQYREYIQKRFDYLLPVQIVEAPSRQAAEQGADVHVWWTNGKMKGPPENPNQLRLFKSDNGHH